MRDLKRSAITIAVDSREQAPFAFPDFTTTTRALDAGDYSVVGAESEIALERKSLPDLIQCLTRERERFERELLRLRGYPHRLVLVESDWAALVSGSYRSRLNPRSAAASVAAFSARYSIGFHFAGTREAAQGFAADYLFQSARVLFHRVSPMLEAMNSRKERGESAA